MNALFALAMWLLIIPGAGWGSSVLMQCDTDDSSLSNMPAGMVGALVGGGMTWLLFAGADGYADVVASILMAIFGSCAAIGIGRVATGRSLTRI